MARAVSKRSVFTLIFCVVLLPLLFIIKVFTSSDEPSAGTPDIDPYYLPTSWWWAAGIVAFLFLYSIKNSGKSK